MIGFISSAVFSLIAYFVLSHLLVTERVTVPISILIFTLLFGLTRYYGTSHDHKHILPSGESSQNGIQNRKEAKENQAGSNMLFIVIFFALVLTCAFNSDENFSVFVPWDKLSGIDILQLGAGIALSFFVPGFALVLILTKNQSLNLVLKVLLGYIFSILITGLTVFFSGLYLDSNGSENNIILTGLYLVIITLFIVHDRTYRIIVNPDTPKALYHLISNLGNKLPKQIEANSSELVVLGSLIGLLVISTYYVYGGVTIGDQWYHQGRALLFLSGNFKEVTLSGGDTTYPPIQSALIAGLTSLSGTALVNAYASIAIINMAALFAFYYFCSNWFPANMKRATLIASTLFLLGSGFGWIYILYLTGSNPVTSPASSIALFTQERIEITDITLSANFMIAAFPDFSTALIYVSLTAGFLLLGLVRSEFKNKYIYTVLVSILASVGLLFHGEFYIFIAISCLLPLVFNMKNRNHIFPGFLLSLVSIYILDEILPLKYFTLNEIFGIPLITFNIIFVSIMWALYGVQQNLHRYPRPTFRLFEHAKRSVYHGYRISFIPRIAVVWLVIYFCALSFLVWTSVPTSYLQFHTSEFTTPWYLYPLRLGTIGLFGLALVLSYLFKRFEKEVFVFGIIALVALLAGPYYNEHRFSKYVMVGMIGFASLIIFKLLIFIADKKPLVMGIVIGTIVISGSLSTLMFIGYNSLELQTKLYDQALAKRDFPSEEQMNMLELMRSEIQVGTNTYNVASFPFDYYSYGIMNKLHAFSGLPISKIEQSQLTLNSSTLDLFYHLLDTSNTKFIIISKNNIDGKKIPDPVKFALTNFQPIYEKDNYIILKVPTLLGPSAIPDSEFAVTHMKDISPIPSDSNRTKLDSIKSSTELQNDTLKISNMQTANQSKKEVLHESKNITGNNEWSKPHGADKDGVNYFQAKFRILAEKNTGNTGIRWIEGDKIYRIRLTSGGLELRQGTIGTSNTSLIFQNAEIHKNLGTWNTLKVASLSDSIDIYVNGERKIKVPRINSEEYPDISKVAIYPHIPLNKSVDFELLEVGKIPSSGQLYDKKNYFENYYPLTLLALSGTGYSSFSDDDYSAFAKRVVILPFDPHNWTESKFNNYVEYARSGGILVVMNADDELDGRFSKLLSVNPTGNRTVEFAKIVKENDMVGLNVSGMVRSSEVTNTSDARVLATYRSSSDKVVAPFVIEKNFPNSGKIILVNDKGYFETIYGNPKEYFLTLQNITGLLNINDEKTIVPQKSTEPVKRFIGDLKLSGEVSINSSSFSFINGSSNSTNIGSNVVSIRSEDEKTSRHFNNVSIADIKLFGQYKVVINSTGNITLPLDNSQYDYIETSLPNGFNMTINLLNKSSYAEIATDENSSQVFNRVEGKAKIELYGVRPAAGASKSLHVLLKSPKITLNGNALFEGAGLYGELPTTNPPLDITGKLESELKYVDHYRVKASGANGTRGQYITYLNSITIDSESKGDKQIKIPADIHSVPKELGVTGQLYKILGSSNNILILIISTIVTLIVGFSLRRYRAKSN